jgi:hypothetical protein
VIPKYPEQAEEYSGIRFTSYWFHRSVGITKGSLSHGATNLFGPLQTPYSQKTHPAILRNIALIPKGIIQQAFNKIWSRIGEMKEPDSSRGWALVFWRELTFKAKGVAYAYGQKTHLSFRYLKTPVFQWRWIYW